MLSYLVVFPLVGIVHRYKQNILKTTMREGQIFGKSFYKT